MLTRRNYTTKERDHLPLEDFAGPNRTYPIETQEDVQDAATLVGHAEHPGEVKANIIKIAKRKGFTLPKSWQKEDDKRMNGKTDIVRSLPSETQLYLPILRIDQEKREIIARATSEALDSYRTVFSYEGSKEAFGKWRGNIREMHDPKKAVGKAISWVPCDDDRAIDITLQVSRGAEDTWLKVLDGTLSGLSVGAKNAQWGITSIGGEEVPYLERYDLVEVSLVDNPANPDCNVSVIRADGLTTEIVEESYEEPEETTVDALESEPERTDVPDETRVGARISKDTSAGMHTTRDHALLAVRNAAMTCGCEECQSLLNILDPDNDGDVDVVASLDTDNDGAGCGDGDGMSLEKSITVEITRSLAPVISRMNGIATNFAKGNHATNNTDVLTRIDSLESKFAGLDEVRSLLSEVKGLATKIAETPLPGGPIVNSSAMQHSPRQLSDAEIVKRAQALGFTPPVEKNAQIDAALALYKEDYGTRR